MVYKNIILLKKFKQKKKIVTKDFVRQLDLNFVIPTLKFLIKKERILRGVCKNSNLLHLKTIFYMLVKELKFLRVWRGISKLKEFFKKKKKKGISKEIEKSGVIIPIGKRKRVIIRAEETYDKLILNLHRSRFYYSFKEVLKKDRLFFLKRFHLLSSFSELIKENKKNYLKKKKFLFVKKRLNKKFKKFFYKEIFSLEDTNMFFKKGEDMIIFSTNRPGRKLYFKRQFDRLTVRKFGPLISFYKNLRRFYFSTFFKCRRLKFRILKKLKKYRGRRRRFKKWIRYKFTITKRGRIVKKFKRRIRHPFFRYYRNRHRAFSRFYIPRYIEINYKTFSFVHLNSKEFSGMSYKIPFYLNLGTLLTFISL